MSAAGHGGQQLGSRKARILMADGLVAQGGPAISLLNSSGTAFRIVRVVSSLTYNYSVPCVLRVPGTISRCATLEALCARLVLRVSAFPAARSHAIQNGRPLGLRQPLAHSGIFKSHRLNCVWNPIRPSPRDKPRDLLVSTERPQTPVDGLRKSRCYRINRQISGISI